MFQRAITCPNSDSQCLGLQSQAYQILYSLPFTPSFLLSASQTYTPKVPLYITHINIFTIYSMSNENLISDNAFSHLSEINSICQHCILRQPSSLSTTPIFVSSAMFSFKCIVSNKHSNTDPHGTPFVSLPIRKKTIHHYSLLLYRQANLGLGFPTI